MFSCPSIHDLCTEHAVTSHEVCFPKCKIFIFFSFLPDIFCISINTQFNIKMSSKLLLCLFFFVIIFSFLSCYRHSIMSNEVCFQNVKFSFFFLQHPSRFFVYFNKHLVKYQFLLNGFHVNFRTVILFFALMSLNKGFINVTDIFLCQAKSCFQKCKIFIFFSASFQIFCVL